MNFAFLVVFILDLSLKGNKTIYLSYRVLKSFYFMRLQCAIINYLYFIQGSSLSCFKTNEKNASTILLELDGLQEPALVDCTSVHCNGECKFCLKAKVALLQNDSSQPLRILDYPLSDCGGPLHEVASLLNITDNGCRNITGEKELVALRKYVLERLPENLKFIAENILVLDVCANSDSDTSQKLTTKGTSKEPKHPETTTKAKLDDMATVNGIQTNTKSGSKTQLIGRLSIMFAIVLAIII